MRPYPPSAISGDTNISFAAPSVEADSPESQMANYISIWLNTISPSPLNPRAAISAFLILPKSTWPEMSPTWNALLLSMTVPHA